MSTTPLGRASHGALIRPVASPACPAERSRRCPWARLGVTRATAIDPAGALRAEGRFAEAAALLEAEIGRRELEGSSERGSRSPELARGVVAHDLGDLAGAAALLADGPPRAAGRPAAARRWPCAPSTSRSSTTTAASSTTRSTGSVEARAIFESVGRLVRGGRAATRTSAWCSTRWVATPRPGAGSTPPGRVRRRGSHRRRGGVRARSRHLDRGRPRVGASPCGRWYGGLSPG